MKYRFSSTKIRKSLLSGDVILANNYLGYDFSFSGVVVYGAKIGHKIGFPTANVKVESPYKLLPSNGVYLVYAFLKQKKCYGMMNIGYRPTVDGSSKVIEVHFFDFNENLYNANITIYLLDHLRKEITFSHLNALQEQLQIDQKIALDRIVTLS